MEVVRMTFESELSADEVEALFRERAGHYREMDGLLQKFSRHDEDRGRFGGVYVFDSAAARDALFDADVHLPAPQTPGRPRALSLCVDRRGAWTAPQVPGSPRPLREPGRRKDRSERSERGPQRVLGA